MSKLLLVLSIWLLCSCADQRSPNDMGSVRYLPPGEYIIWNTGSRHMVKCLRADGTYYWLNDTYFVANNIPGHDAHQYRNKTKIIVK